MTPEELKPILDLHKKWARGFKSGERACFKAANFRGTNLYYKDLRGAEFVDCSFTGVNLNSAEIQGAAFLGCCNFIDCNFTDTDARSTRFIRTRFEGCDFTGTKFSDAAFGTVCGLRYASVTADWLGTHAGTLSAIDHGNEGVIIHHHDLHIRGSWEDLESQIQWQDPKRQAGWRIAIDALKTLWDAGSEHRIPLF